MMTPSLSGRGLNAPASPIRNLVPYAEQARAKGLRVYHLNIGQPDLETPVELRRRLRQLESTCIAYSPAQGTPAFIATMRRYYGSIGIDLEEDEILATTGGSEAILFALSVCADPGDDVLVVEPFYANYRGFASMAGVGIAAVTSRGRDGFHLPPLHVWERELTPRTRAVLLCNPNNPTGAVYSREEVEMVAELCRRKGLFLISDEVYREFTFDDRRATSALELPELESHVIVADSLSKRYSSCGLRLGCLVTRNADVYRSALRMAQARLAPPGLAQYVAVGIEDLADEYVSSIRAEYESRRNFLYEALREIPDVYLAKPEGAFYFIAQLPVDDADDFARWLLADFELEGATLMLAPARGFYLNPELGRDEVRIAYVLRREELEVAVRILRKGLSEYRVQRGLTSPPDAPREADLRQRMTASE
jgi:aspartate aminotransferase